MQKFTNDDSLKNFLKKESSRLNISINNVYNTYFSRLFLERISKYNNKEVIVKGSFAQFVHLRKFVRPIVDIDLTSIEGHHDPILVMVQAMSDSHNDDLIFNFRKKTLPKRNRNL